MSRFIRSNQSSCNTLLLATLVLPNPQTCRFRVHIKISLVYHTLIHCMWRPRVETESERSTSTNGSSKGKDNGEVGREKDKRNEIKKCERKERRRWRTWNYIFWTGVKEAFQRKQSCIPLAKRCGLNPPTFIRIRIIITIDIGFEKIRGKTLSL